MSCGGMGLMTGPCGCGPGVNRHESYKGSDGATSRAFNYSANLQYQKNDAPLPRTQVSRSYGIERVYAPLAAERLPERVYAPRNELPLTSSPAELPPATIDVVLRQGRSQKTQDVQRYDARQSIAELGQLDEVYAKQRVLESKLAEALSIPVRHALDPLVN